MIIKNPYGFISKHYKVILLILLVPLLYIVLKYSDIAKFFRDYISSSYKTVETNIAESYVTGLCIFTLVIMTIIHLVIGIIIKSKKKNALIHFVNAIYYIILLAFSVLFSASMNTIEAGSISSTFVRFVRDMANLSFIPGIVLLVWQGVKGIGFNLKSFRFERETGLELSDDEETDDAIEIKIDNNKPSTTSGLVHLIRELKYYVLENKLIFRLVGIAILIALVITIYVNFQVYNKNVSVNQAFVLDNFTMSLKESYLTDVDYRGNVIEEGKYFLAVKIGIYNKTKIDSTIDNTNFRIFIGDEVIYPSYDRASRFVDVGTSYYGQTIYAGQSDDYVLVYELTADQLQSQYQLKILSGLEDGETEIKTKYKIINIRPTNLLKQESLGTGTIGKELDLSKTILGDTKYTLESITIDTNYPYSYQQCNINNVCSTISNTVVPSNGNLLLIIKDNIVWDETTSYYKNGSKDFYFDFVTIEYDYKISSGVRHTSTTLTNITPSNIEGVKLYEVPSNIKNGYNKKLIIRLRNQVITIDFDEEEEE